MATWSSRSATATQWLARPDSHADLLINLGGEVPGFVGNFQRVAEIVVEAPAIREAARERFRFYREQGYALHNHRLQRL